MSNQYQPVLQLTRMASPLSTIETAADVERLLDEIIADPEAKLVFMNMALCDFDGQIEDFPSGKHAPRLQTRAGSVTATLTPAAKLIGKLRKTRKDLFVVGFKTTTNATPAEQYAAGLRLLKENSLNLVLANDTVTRANLIVVPEESYYGNKGTRDEVLVKLVKMTLLRSTNRFTQSTVADGALIQWTDPVIPENLRTVVNWCIANGAYKPFLGKTVGHFATRGAVDGQIITSIRKSNFNKLAETGMVRVQAEGDDKVIAFGAKPSVGGQSQRIVFNAFPELDCIVHFHCPLRADAVDDIPIRTQFPFECGSHECGQNTADGLRLFGPANNFKNLAAVMLDNHGPNIVFSRNTPAAEVISFIERNFDLAAKTGGLLDLPARADLRTAKAGGSVPRPAAIAIS